LKSIAEAPGKVILAGEHFVVWGSTALAAAIDKRVRATAELADEDEIMSENYGTTSKLSNGIAKGLYPIAKTIYATKNYIGSRKKVRVAIKSYIPSSAGLGSSSAVAVSTVASVAGALDAKLTQKEIFDLAIISEKIVHGNPSGIDVAVAAYGGVLLFRKGEQPKEVKVNVPFEIVVGLSGLSRKTARMINRVAETRRNLPNFFDVLVSSSSHLSVMVSKSLADGNYNDMAAIMSFHNSTLSWFGLSTQQTDRMIETCLANGALAAKITGGGGGGAVVALPKQGKAEDVVSALKSRNFEAFSVKLPQQGVKLWKE
jgi:mevalonate kinase